MTWICFGLFGEFSMLVRISLCQLSAIQHHDIYDVFLMDF